MPISVTEPISKALDRTKNVLFKPFNLGKWCTLGFCAFLAQCGEGGGSGFNFPGNWGGGGGGGGGGGPTGQDIENWIKNNMPMLIGIAVAAFLLVFAISLLIVWLKCRGRFMLIDNIVRNQGAVVEPWKALKMHGNSLFAFSIVYGLIAMVVFLVIIGGSVLIAWPDIQRGEFDTNAIIAIVVGGVLMLIAGFASLIISLLLNDFVAPTMYLRNERVMAAWSTVRQELFPGNIGPIVLFYLMKFVLSLAIGVAAMMLTCATCCVAALPYVGAVILLPFTVFMYSYGLYFLEQFGRAWRVFIYDGLRCPACAYDLRMAPPMGVCPECGSPYSFVQAPPIVGQLPA